MNIKESDKISAAQEEVMGDVRESNRRYELFAWGALFILFGIINLVPGVPAGTGWLGIAIILMGLNLVRYLSKIPISIVSSTLGVIHFSWVHQDCSISAGRCHSSKLS